MKRTVSLFALIALLGMMLAACGGAPAAQPTTAPAEPTAAATEPTAAATEPTAAATEATTATEGAATTGGTIKIASQSPLSGPQSVLGVSIQQSAELAVKQLAGPLTDLGLTVELAPFDDQALAEVGSANAKAIVSDPDILCVVGHLNSGVALASLPDYQSASLPMVSPANTNPRITESGYPNAFRVVGRDDLQGPIGARFAQETLGAKSVYIVHDTTEYGQGVAEFFRDEATKLGVTVVGFEGTQEQAVFDSLITPILAAAPDVIYFGGLYPQAGPFFRQARDRGVTAKFLGPDGLDSSELANLGGDAIEGTYYTTVAAPVTFFPDAATFATDYQAEFGETVQPFGAQAYDSAGICITAITKAAEAAGGKPTREQVLAAIQELDPYQGITGTYDFTAKGDPTEAAYYILAANTDPAKWNDNKLAALITSAPPSGE